MTIEKIDGVWADSGVTTPEPSDEKKAVGWVSGTAADRPFVEYFNYLQNRVENAIDRIIEERVNSFYDGATDPKKQISTGLWSDSWGCTSDTANVLDGGATKTYRDMAVFFAADGSPRLLVADNTNCKIEVWNPRTMEHETASDSGALTDDLPSDASETWQIESMCTDGESVYVVFADTNAAPKTHQIQAWKISDWTVKSGWAAVSLTGTALPGTGTGVWRGCKVIVASETKLATANTWVTISADSSTAISIIDITDGTIDASGAGDANTAESAIIIPSFCSDGTYIYFATYAAANLRICSASIADPTAGCGGANYPLDRGNFDYAVLVSCGTNLIVSINWPSGSVETDIVMRTHNSSDADWEQFTLGQDCSGTPIVGDNFALGNIHDAVFDGLNIWGLSFITPGEDMDDLVKIDVGKLSLLDHNASYRQITDVIGGQYVIHPNIVARSGAGNWYHKSIVFDGRDIWALPESAASQDCSGKLYRLPLALLRS